VAGSSRDGLVGTTPDAVAEDALRMRTGLSVELLPKTHDRPRDRAGGCAPHGGIYDRRRGDGDEMNRFIRLANART
jgi:hypothetical protein